MIRITKHTSNICGCITWFQWDDQEAQGSRVFTDIAVSPCQVHDPVNYGKTLIADTTHPDSVSAVSRSSDKPLELIADVRPSQVKDVIPLSKTIAPREEMYLREGTRAVLLQVSEISEDELDEKGAVIGRKFKDGISFEAAFDASRKMSFDLKGATQSEKDAANTAIDSSDIDGDKIVK